MTLNESINATLAQSSRYQKVESFTKSFRTGELGNIEVGEEFIIPEDYTIISQKIIRGEQPVKDREGKDVTAEFIKCMTTDGRIVHFFPTSLTKIAFRVDPETGKDILQNRIVRTSGDLVDYVRNHPDMNATMKALVGCTIKLDKVEKVPVRNFGVSNEKATKDDVSINNIGTWSLVGEKRPANWTVD